MLYTPTYKALGVTESHPLFHGYERVFVSDVTTQVSMVQTDLGL
jgi:hypothetical protein